MWQKAECGICCPSGATEHSSSAEISSTSAETPRECLQALSCVCVCVCCASCSLWVLFRSECVSLFACVCVPAALHPCRRANLLATSHSSFPEKEVLSRWQSHDAPLPSRCCNGRRWLQPRRGRKWGICLFLRGRYSAFYFSVPH